MSDQGGSAAHLAYLDAMGIQVWQRRHAPDAGSASLSEATLIPPPSSKGLGGGEQLIEGAGNPVDFYHHPPAPSFKEGGLKSAPQPVVQTVAPPSSAAIQQPVDWTTLQVQVASCTRCELHRQRTNTVFGVGNRNASWMFIGEAPGADEDQQGEPFVGKAGQLLNLMFKSVGLEREEVYIANIVKCRPPGNRDPKPEEAAACEGYLQQQIALVRPRIIIAVGRIAAQNLLKTDQPVGVLRNKIHRYGESQIPLIVTYHPAYLLRSPQEKRKAWEDLLFARQIVSTA